MPLRLRVLPSSRKPSGDGRAPTSERAVEFADNVGEIRIGRRPDLELPLPFTILSSVHARLVRAQEPATGGWLLEDLGSRNGTFLGGMRLPPGQKRVVSPGASISLGHVDIVFDGPSAVVSGSEGTATIARRLVADLFAAGPEAGAPTLVVVSGAPGRGVLRLEERDRRYVVGRVESCDLRLAVEEISREHAGFTRKWDGVFVSDLGSKNGIRVSGVLAERQRVRDGDLVQIGPVSLRLFDPEDRYLRDFEARAEAAGAEAEAPAARPVPAPEIHPAIAGALAADGGERSASFVERTAFRLVPTRSSFATFVAALVLAAIAAAVVTIVFG